MGQDDAEEQEEQEEQEANGGGSGLLGSLDVSHQEPLEKKIPTLAPEPALNDAQEQLLAATLAGYVAAPTLWHRLHCSIRHRL
jgi:hypothetical protein